MASPRMVPSLRFSSKGLPSLEILLNFGTSNILGLGNTLLGEAVLY